MTCTASVPRIVIVEPHKSALAVMARRLSDAGYRVVTCDNAADAVSELHRAPVALLLAEVRMTATSGIELTRLVRDDSKLCDLPVILINGRSDSNGTCDALAAGADAIITKPFDFDVLIAKVARLIARSRAMGELRQDNAALDARIITRAIELGEAKAALQASESERMRLAALLAS